MNQLQVFNHEMFGELPVITVNGAEWFGATEAAKSLSFSNPYAALKNHVELDDLTDHEVIDRLKRNQQKKFVNESGLYDLIFGAAKQGNNPEIRKKAKAFRRWVTSEVLPSIRKDGGYIVASEDDDEESIMAKAILIANKTIERKNQEIAEQKKVIETQRPKVLFADSVEASQTSILIRELAVILKQNGIDTGEKRLYEWLRENGYLIKRFGTDRNTPTQKSMDLGLFEIKETPINHNSGMITVSKTTKVTGKGQVYFINKFLSLKKVV